MRGFLSESLHCLPLAPYKFYGCVVAAICLFTTTQARRRDTFQTTPSGFDQPSGFQADPVGIRMLADIRKPGGYEYSARLLKPDRVRAGINF